MPRHDRIRIHPDRTQRKDSIVSPKVDHKRMTWGIEDGDDKHVVKPLTRLPKGVPGSKVASIANTLDELSKTDGSDPKAVNKKLASLYGKSAAALAARYFIPGSGWIISLYEVGSLIYNKLQDKEYKDKYDKENPGLHRPGEW